MVHPFVFQCAKCNQIFGDSSWWFVSTASLSCYTLSNFVVKTVHVDDAISVAPDDAKDAGSTYRELACSSCGALIGKVYKSTPPALDHLREKYTFYTSQTKCYEIGNLEAIPKAVDGDIVEATRPEPSNIAKRFAVLEAIVLSLNQRIETLESPRRTSTGRE